MLRINRETATHWFRQCFAEFIGTAIFIFCATENARSVTVELHSGTEASLTAVALTHGFSLCVLIYSLGNISGAHFNPAVTWSMMITGNIPWALGASYIVAQLFGSVVGAGILSSVVGTKFTGNLQLGMNISTAQGFAIEMAMTFVLVFVVFSVAVNSARDVRYAKGLAQQRAVGFEMMAPLVIGVTVAACLLVAGPVSGCGMNPARAWGPALVSGDWKNHWIYWIGPWLGGSLAPCVYYGLSDFYDKKKMDMAADAEKRKAAATAKPTPAGVELEASPYE